MSLWATVRPEARPVELHVVPVSADDQILNGHVCRVSCWCQPVLDETAYAYGSLLMVHKDPERGGCNA